MRNLWKWILGSALLLVSLILPFAWRFSLTSGGYRMMGYGYGWHMPMMYGGFGMMGFGMLFMVLISLASLVLIGLGIVWLVKSLAERK
jgi:hypothetical protein